jgi:hypothetical protein
MAHHPSHVPPGHDLWENHFPRCDEKTAAEDFTKTIGLRDNNKTSHNNTRDKVLCHHKIINSHQLYWSTDHQQENRYIPK